MAKTSDCSPFLSPSTFVSNPSESLPSSSSSPPPPSFCSSRSNSSFNSPYKSPSRSPLSPASSSYFPPANFGTCAACQFHNRLCSDKCYIASFLPPNEVHNFVVVDSVFGSSNVVNFLQHNSNSSYTPLLLLLSREDEVNSDPNSNTEVNIQKPLADPIQQLYQWREQAEQSKLHLGSGTSDIDSEDFIERVVSSIDKSQLSDPVQQLYQWRKQAEQHKLHLGSGTLDIDNKDLAERVVSSVDKSQTILIANNHLSKSPDSDPNSNTEVNIQKPLGDPVQQLDQWREQAEKRKLHLGSGTLDIDSKDIAEKVASSVDKSQTNLITNNHLSKSPDYSDDSPGSFKFFETVECSPFHKSDAKKRKTLPTWTDTVRVTSDNGLESDLHDGYSWIKYGKKDVGAKYPRSYYRCIHRNTQNCLATKRVKRSDEDPNIFEISYRRAHTCYDGPQLPALPEKQNNMSGSNQQQQLQLDLSLT